MRIVLSGFIGIEENVENGGEREDTVDFSEDADFYPGCCDGFLRGEGTLEKRVIVDFDAGFRGVIRVDLNAHFLGVALQKRPAQAHILLCWGHFHVVGMGVVDSLKK